MHWLHRERLWLAPVFLAAFIPYWWTLYPTFHTHNTAEFAAGAWTLGIVHNPGYPTYLLLGHVFQHLLPIGDPAYRLNLMSALTAALTVALLAYLIWVLTRSRLAASAAALLFAYGHTQWSMATMATPYTAHTAAMAAELLLLLRWREDRRPWRLYAFAAIYGLHFGLHTSAILAAPGYALLVSSAHPSLLRQPGVLFRCGALAVLGLATFLYLPLRYLAHPGLDYARGQGFDLTRADDLLAMMSGQPFSHAMFAYGPAQTLQATLTFGGWLWANWLGLGVVLGLAGLVWLARASAVLAGGLALVFLAHSIFMINFDSPTKETMFLPSYLVWGIWVGVAIARLQGRWAELLSGVRPSASAAQRVGLLFLALAFVPLTLNFSRLDASQDYTARLYAESVMRQLPPGALVVGSWLDVRPLEYLQVAEGGRADLELLDVMLYGHGVGSRLLRQGVRDRAVVTAEIEAGLISILDGELERRPVYALGRSPFLESAFHLEQDGQVYRVERRAGLGVSTGH